MKAPVLFVGHGSPMNALAENSYTKALNELGVQLKGVRAIVAISAHWFVPGTLIQANQNPKQIYDFFGFPKQLYQVKYPAIGDAKLAQKLQQLLPASRLSEEWGIDHGVWAVLMHLFPKADIPAVQVSIDTGLSPKNYNSLGQQLKDLREDGVLILGSGNLVHNLREISWQEDAPVHSWAKEFDELVASALTSGDFQSLIDFQSRWPDLAHKAHPTIEHYLPLLYCLGAVDPSEPVSFPYTGLQNASISMRSVMW